MQHRVQKLLSNYGFCSRRKAERLIEEGKVKVNGKRITIGDKADENDEIVVCGWPVKQEKRVYIIFHKPVGCVTALRDRESKTVMDYIKIDERVFPIGRLDYYTSGLLLLTTDGDFANQIMHPRYEIKKTYIVEIDRPISKKDMLRIQKGIKLRDGTTAPAKVKRLNLDVLEIIIHEGKNRIIRRMINKLKYKVLSLERVAIGKLKLGNLKPGKFKVIDKPEI